MNEILITMEGGIIQNVEGVNLDRPLKVRIMDFDVEGLEPEEVQVNQYGEEYYGQELELAPTFNVWASDSEFPVEDWHHEVAAYNTRRGYWDWVEAMREQREV